MNLPLKNTLTLNIPSPQAGLLKIGDQAQLRGKKIRAVIARIGAAGGTDKTSSGKPVASALWNAFLVLVTSGGKTLHDNVPLSLLDPTRNSGKIQEFSGEEIDWTKSYINYPGWVAADANAEVPLLVVYE